MESIEIQPIDSIFKFKKWGDTFQRVAFNPETDVFIFQRINNQGRIICLEVVKPRIRKGVRCYPSTDDFGSFGKCIMYNEKGRSRAMDLLRNGW